MKIRYIELKPIQQILDFEDREKYGEFILQRMTEIIDYVYSNNLKYNEYFQFEKVGLKKDGSPRKKMEVRVMQLQTPEIREKQKEAWKKYCEKRKAKTQERNRLRRIADIDFEIQELQKEKESLGRVENGI